MRRPRRRYPRPSRRELALAAQLYRPTTKSDLASPTPDECALLLDEGDAAERVVAERRAASKT